MPADEDPKAAARPQPDLLLVRHGQSLGNAGRRFVGWRDEGLSDLGRAQAAALGAALRRAGWSFEVAVSSELSRAVDTAAGILAQTGDATEHRRTWLLNERHCGAFQGLGKDEVVRRFGDEALRRFRRAWHERPPPADADDDAPRPPAARTRGESLADLAARLQRCWQVELLPLLRERRPVLVVAHAISLRALVAAMQPGEPEQLPELTLANCEPRGFRVHDDGVCESVAVTLPDLR